ncbi:MAG: DUF3048 domain-containing protein [Chloroflexi bacterium]|nr:DUF3048 domain-containing protein [Chloroflexota bacterium]
MTVTDRRRRLALVLVVAVVVAGAVLVLGGNRVTPPVVGAQSPSPEASPTAVAAASLPESPTPAPSPTVARTPAPTVAPTASPSPMASSSPPPSPTPSPSPTTAANTVPAPLTGMPVTKTAAARHPIAVMIDDHPDARPQSGFNAASVVWHAPAEGGIPRYMLVFQEMLPGSIGPIRSARQYYIQWAAEWRSAYVHAGGAPNALTTLRQHGDGQLVYNADYARWGKPNAPYIWRITTRFAPHNVYSTGAQLQSLADRIGAKGAVEMAWRFGSALPLAQRRIGGSIRVTYRFNQIDYAYDRVTNTYPRSVMGRPQIDADDGRQVAPTNVIVMFVRFAPLPGDPHPEKLRLAGDVIGTGKAYIATNGKALTGTWSKKSNTSPTVFLDAKGRPVALTPGQTFIQVVATGTKVHIVGGTDP